MNGLPTIRVAENAILPDNDQWHFRFEIKSESSNKIYIVSQNKKGRFWGCSCPGWKAHRHCKHLKSMGLPGDEKPFEAKVIGE